MRSSFEDLITREPTVKTLRNSDTRFKSYFFLNFFHVNVHVLYVG